MHLDTPCRRGEQHQQLQRPLSTVGLQSAIGTFRMAQVRVIGSWIVAQVCPTEDQIQEHRSDGGQVDSRENTRRSDMEQQAVRADPGRSGDEVIEVEAGV
jgi:hypothetical protein